MEEKEQHEWVVVWSVRNAFRQAKSRKDCLLTLQIGDTAHEQVAFPAKGAPDGECDNLILCVETRRELHERKKQKIAVQKLAENNNTKDLGGGAEVHSGPCKSIGNHQRDGEVLGGAGKQPPTFDMCTYPHASVTEGDEVLALRRGEHGTQRLFVDNSKIS